MNNYQRMIDKISNIICQDQESVKTYILIGDNSSGKSEILWNVVNRKLNDAVYYIDSVNRTFDTNKVEFFSKVHENIVLDSKKVIENRIREENFNLRDTFFVASCIEQLYVKYEDTLRKMCEEFLQVSINIYRENYEIGIAENIVEIDGNRVKLSSGYQAILRLFCEMLFFIDCMVEKQWEYGVVVIDEIDEYLSPKHSAEILKYLQEKFPTITFVVTTHSKDLVEKTPNTVLVIIKESAYQVYTVKEDNDEHVADRIFMQLFFEDRIQHKSNDDELDKSLRNLLNMKIADLWNEAAEKELEEIEKKTMKPHHKLIVKQIKEW